MSDTRKARFRLTMDAGRPRPAGGKAVITTLPKLGLAVLIGVTIGVALWIPLLLHERSHIAHVTKLEARSLQADITNDLEAEILAVIRLAKLATFEDKPSPQAWRSDAQLFLADHPSYVAIYWADAAYDVQWTVLHDDGNDQQFNPASDPSLKSALRAARELGHRQLSAEAGTPDSDRNQVEATLSPAFRMPNGEWGSQIIVPVHKDQRLIGMLAAVFEVRKALEDILRDHSELGYAVSVSYSGNELYRMSTLGSEPGQWAQEADIGLRGANWQIRVWPEADLLAEIKSKLPAVTLGIGTLLGFLLVLTFHFARTAQVNAWELQRAHDEMELRVEHRTAEVHELSGRLLQSQDEERRRIARELHDSTAQVLGAVSINLEKARNTPVAAQDTKLHGLLDESVGMVEQATSEIRILSHLLHPPMLDEFGLAEVLPEYAAGFQQRTGIEVTVDVPADLGRFPHEVELTLFRIVQESLANIHRHSGSPTAGIALSIEAGRVSLRVRDEGRGMGELGARVNGGSMATLGVGLVGMRERVRQLGGRLDIQSSATGTCLTVVLPLPAEQAAGASKSS